MNKNLLNTVFARQNRNTGLWDVRVDGKLYSLGHLRPASATREGNKIARELMAAATDVHAATRAEGRKQGLSEEQIYRFIARMAG